MQRRQRTIVVVAVVAVATALIKMISSSGNVELVFFVVVEVVSVLGRSRICRSRFSLHF